MLRRKSLALVVAFVVALPVMAQDLDQGLAAYKSSDYAAALAELLPLARRGDPIAQSYVGVIYHHGLGVEADLAKAVRWYEKAANGGDVLAQRILGDLHVEGVSGSPDYAAAAQWYEAAANGGDTEAQRKLGELYLAGRGVPRDPKIAAGWLNSAKEQGDPGARQKLQEAQVKPPTSPNKKHRRRHTASLRRPSSCISGMPDAPYHVDVKIDFPPTHLNHSLSRAELGKITGAGHNQRIFGLMKPDMRLKTHPRAQGMSMGNKYCFWINGFEIILRYSRIEIYVAREYLVGSCTYKAILNHELQHVLVARRNLNQYAPLIRKVLISSPIPTAQTPIIVASATEATRDVQEISEESLAPIYKSMMRSLERAQNIVDSPQSYARVFRRCSDW